MRFKPGQRVHFHWPDGLCGACHHNAPNNVGIVVESEEQREGRTPVHFDGDDYISYALTDCLHHDDAKDCPRPVCEPRTPFHGKPNEPIVFKPQDTPKC